VDSRFKQNAIGEGMTTESKCPIAGAIERHAMSTIIVPTVNSIAMNICRPVQIIAAISVAFGNHVQVGIRTVSDLIEHRFAEFAGVPYQNSHSRQQWEELFRSEP
jgi:hypothetical protein